MRPQAQHFIQGEPFGPAFGFGHALGQMRIGFQHPPEMGRGKGVRLQKYKDGGLNDARVFTLAQGLSWLDPAGRTRTVTDLVEWSGARASAGRMAPRGFPQDNKFT